MLTLSEEHVYRLDGKIIPSVSEIMRPLTDGYYEEATKFNSLEKAANYGSGVHQAIEDYCYFGAISSQFLNEVTAFITWMEREKIKVQHNEMMLTNGKYAGTVDLLVTNEFGEFLLVDLKATSKINEPLLEVQLAAYLELCLVNGYRIAGAYVLHLRKNGNYTYKQIAINRTRWKGLYEQYTNKNVKHTAIR